MPTAVADPGRGDRHATPIVVAAIAGAAAIGASAALCLYASRYFFLFDDFALVSIAGQETVARIAAEPLIGFYRPVPFWMLHGEAIAFAWDWPAAYLGVSLLLHAINALLCGLLARTFNPPRFTAALAACLFLLSPWATEAFLWVSGRFDLLSTLGVLVALLGVRRAVAGQAVEIAHAASGGAGPRERGRAYVASGIALALVGSCCGYFSKEQAIVLPALAVLVLLVDRPVRALLQPAAWLAIAATLVPMALYLLVRAHVLGMLQGAYGSFTSLWSQAHLVENIWSYVRAFAWVPSRPAWPPQDVTLSTLPKYAFLWIALPIALVSLALRHGRLAALCAAGFLIAVLPVSWFGLSPQSTVGGRFEYLPAMWPVIALAVGLADAIEWLPPRLKWPAPLVAALVLVLTFGYMTASLLYQIELWRLACGLSRTTFDQVERYRGRRDIALEIENMPHIAAEGPYVLKAYAFRLYRNGGLPPVTAHMALVKLAWNGQAVATLGVDPSSDFIEHAPAGLTVQPVRLTLLLSVP